SSADSRSLTDTLARRRWPWTDSPAIGLELRAGALVAAAVLVIWAAAGAGQFWPMWGWFGIALPVALHIALRSAWHSGRGRERRLRLHAAVSGVLAAALVLIWAVAGGGFFWPISPLLALGGLIVLHALLFPPRDHDRLEARVDELTRSRLGALDLQAAQ